jgi:hypothetical protein
MTPTPQIFWWRGAKFGGFMFWIILYLLLGVLASFMLVKEYPYKIQLREAKKFFMLEPFDHPESRIPLTKGQYWKAYLLRCLCWPLFLFAVIFAIVAAISIADCP